MNIQTQKKTMLITLTIILTLIISTNAYSTQLNNAEKIDAQIQITLPIKFFKQPNYDFKFLEIEYPWIPLEDYRQQILNTKYNLEPYKIEEKAHFRITKPENFDLKTTYQMKLSSEPIKVKNKIDFPIKDIDRDIQRYLEFTNLTDTDNDIKMLASDLAGNHDDLYLVVFNVADWVNSNIEYNLSTTTAEANLPSSWVLRERQGVCDELSNLFISLLRSLGIPSRFVTGLAYTDSDLFDEPWGPHGWVEVYFPGYGWIPFDPTYNQAGFVDATHIKFTHGVDGTPRKSSYSWSSKGVDVQIDKPLFDVTILNLEERKTFDIDLQVKVMEKLVGLGSHNVIIIEIKNLKDYYVTETLRVSKTQGLEFQENNKEILLKPRETKTIYWPLSVSEQLEKGYIYTFPISIQTNRGEQIMISFQAKQNEMIITENAINMLEEQTKLDDHPIKMFYCEHEEYLQEGQPIIISCTLEGEGTKKMCLNNECKIIQDYKETTMFYISPRQSGFETIKFTANTEGYEDISHYVTLKILDEPKIHIETKNIEPLNYADQTTFEFVLESKSFNQPKNVKVILKHDYFIEEWFFEELEKQIFQVEFKAKNMKYGENEFTMILEYEDGKQKVYDDLLITKFEVSGTFFERIKLWFNRLAVHT